MNQVLTVFFGTCVVTTTMLNIAFTLAPETMTHILQAMIAA